MTANEAKQVIDTEVRELKGLASRLERLLHRVEATSEFQTAQDNIDAYERDEIGGYDDVGQDEFELSCSLRADIKTLNDVAQQLSTR